MLLLHGQRRNWRAIRKGTYLSISSLPSGLRLWMLYTRQRLFNSRQQHICRKFFNNFWYVIQLIEFVCHLSNKTEKKRIWCSYNSCFSRQGLNFKWKIDTKKLLCSNIAYQSDSFGSDVILWMNSTLQFKSCKLSESGCCSNLWEGYLTSKTISGEKFIK